MWHPSTPPPFPNGANSTLPAPASPPPPSATEKVNFNYCSPVWQPPPPAPHNLPSSFSQWLRMSVVLKRSFLQFSISENRSATGRSVIQSDYSQLNRSAPYDWCNLSGYKPQALVYDILPSTTAVFSYVIGPPKKLSVNEQFFVGAQTVVSLLQTTQIIPDVCFITDNAAYASSNKTKIVWIETELFFSFLFTWGGCASCLRACLGARLLPQS